MPRSGPGLQPGALAVFSTKNREPLITAPIRENLHKYIGGIVRGEGGALLEIGGIPDHVHLVVRFKSEPSVATMIKILKSKSSKWLNEQPKRPGRFEWQRGYAAFTVSVSQLEKVRAYVRNKSSIIGERVFRRSCVRCFTSLRSNTTNGTCGIDLGWPLRRFAANGMLFGRQPGAKAPGSMPLPLRGCYRAPSYHI